MSKSNKIFNSVPVPVPERSGFDLSHEVLTTARTGTVIPITHMEVLPGDTISMGSMMKVTLPPFAVPFMGRIDAELTAAFIPNRLLWNGWQSFITNNNGVNTAGNTAPFVHDEDGNLIPGNVAGRSNVPICVPLVDGFSAQYAESSDGKTWRCTGPGSLASYLGFKDVPDLPGRSLPISALPFLAYHKFCDDWIRDENIMKPFFPKIFDTLYWTNDANSYVRPSIPNVHLLPFVNGDLNSVHTPFSLNDGDEGRNEYTYPNLPYNGSLAIGRLRQRCWSKDYFTTATTRPQAGADSQVLFNVSGTADLVDGAVSGSGGFTIATLRAANSLQKWLERNNIAGTEYGSQILAHFGVTPPDAVLNRSLLLGSVRTPVVVNSVENTSNAEAASTKNPYGSVLGSAAGFGSGFDKGSLVDNFTAKEHGFIMVFFTLIPHQYYNSGIERSLLHRYIGDFAWPEFAGIGDQPVFNSELSANNAELPELGVWGYQQRFVEYKHKLDVVSGLLQDGESLSAYALQRGFESVPALGSEFLEIPDNYLDQVLGVSEEVGGFGCIVDAYFDCKAVRCLPEYSLPHL